MSYAFTVTSGLLRVLPARLPGKMRFARIAVRAFQHLRSPRIVDKFGNRLTVPDLREPIALGLFASGVYEPETIRTIMRHLPQSGVFVDVGANIGAISLPIASLCPTARVVAVEADPRIAGILRKNVTENNRRNVSVFQYVAGAHSATVRFYRAPNDHFGMGSIGPQFAHSDEELPQRTLDALLDEAAVESVDVVKLDIEGAEFGALRGLSRRLSAERPPVVILEFVDWAESRIEGQRAGDAQHFLLSLGYRLFAISAGGKMRAMSQPATSGTAMILATRGKL